MAHAPPPHAGINVATTPSPPTTPLLPSDGAASDDSPLVSPFASGDLTSAGAMPGSSSSSSAGALQSPTGTQSPGRRKPMSRREASSHSGLVSRLKYYRVLGSSTSGVVGDNPFAEPPPHVLPPTLFFRFLQPAGGKRGSLAIIFSIWNTMMGSTLLTLPWAFNEAGVLLGTLLSLLYCVLSYYTCYLILKNGKRKDEFADVCARYLGRWSKVLAYTASLMVLVGASIAYDVYMTDCLYSVVNTASDWHHAGTSADEDEHHHVSGWTRYTAAGVVWLVAFPLTNLPNVDVLVKVSSWGIISVFYIMFYMVFQSVHTEGLHVGGAELANTHFPSLAGILAMSYFIHNGVLPIMHTSAEPKKAVRNLGVAYSAVGICYTLVGVMTGLAFSRGNVEQIFLNTFSDKDVPSIIARVAVFSQLATVYPLLVILIRTQFFGVLSGKQYPGWVNVFLLNLVVTGITTAFAMFYPKVGTVLGMTGAFAGFTYVFTLPILVNIKRNRRRGRMGNVEFGLQFVVLAVGVASVVLQFVPI